MKEIYKNKWTFPTLFESWVNLFFIIFQKEEEILKIKLQKGCMDPLFLVTVYLCQPPRRLYRIKNHGVLLEELDKTQIDKLLIKYSILDAINLTHICIFMGKYDIEMNSIDGGYGIF